ncbi:hypothetical protein N7466_001803 [Penicillium verhagenii]|uniref:uncharacterized protein n=1 Tax=Penicillium verhagenii TaxID=1562060 RepID=UPI00254574B3|nr:uncharacterized protein N7466_001803 [Penicillium verhagenii]KAJ5938669.1 hypothetical protein N7466_001803 [Penicillium verhagenii]
MAVPNDKKAWEEGAERYRGQRLLPHIIDYYAHHEPDRVFASILKSGSLDNGFEDITMARLATAVNYVSWWLSKNLKTRNTRRTLAYIGPSDLRYTVIFLAAIKCRWRTFFISHRNPITLNLGLLQQSDVSALLYADTLKSPAKSIQKFDPSISCKQMPSMNDIFNSESPDFPFEASWSDIKDENCLILHSSGSTGPPTLVNYTHASFSCTDNDPKIPVPPGRRPQNGSQFMFDTPGRYYSSFPIFHLLGIQAYILIPSFFPTSTVVMGPPHIAPSGSLVDTVIREQNVRALWLPPPVIEQWISNPSSLVQAEKLQFVAYGGGIMSKAAGDKLNKVTDVCQIYGSVEAGQVQLLVPQKGDWQFLEFNPVEECDMQEVEDGVHELVFHNDKKFLGRRTLSHTFPDVQTWRSRDLFTPHPTKPGLWSFYSRKEDIIVLANNQRVWPIPMENVISGDPLISGALVVGNDRPEVLLLVEPRSSPEVDRMSKKEFIDAIWPMVAQANRIAPSHAKIRRSRITLSQPNLGFIRTPKGMIARKPTESLYSEYITAAFVDGTTDEQGEIGVLENYWTDEAKRFIGSVVHDIRPDSNIRETDDFFVLKAMDSLSVLELGQKLKLGLSGRMDKEKNTIDFWMRTIFENPTIESLATATLDAVFGHGESGQSEQRFSVDGLVEDLIAHLPEPMSTTPPPPLNTENIKIVLLGCQGRLGPYLVRSLLDDERVAGIKCLDCGPDVREMFQMRVDELGLDVDSRDPRLQFVPINLAKPALGLPEKHLDEICTHADVIIHSIWTVNYALSLASFTPEVLKSVFTVIDIANCATSRPRVVFASSVGSVHRWAKAISPTVPVPEEVVNCAAVAMETGYGQSKQVAERFLAAAGAKLQIPISILRIGQIAGPTKIEEGGKWESRDWLQSLAILSKASGLVPTTDLAHINWIPVDQMASVIQEIALREQHDDHETATPNVQLYNIVHPRPSPTSKFSEGLQKCISSPRMVGYPEWVSHLSGLPPNRLSKEAEEERARVLPFFQTLVSEGFARFDINKALAVSPTMSGMEPISVESIVKWCRQWTATETEDL